MVTGATGGIPRWWEQPPADWPAFHDALAWAMDGRGEALPSPLGPTLTVGRNALALDRLAADLRRLPAARRPAAAARRLADHADQKGEPGRAPVARLDAVRPRLLPRDGVPDGVQARIELGAGLVGTLALVAPRERWVTAEDIAGWNLSGIEVWDTAVQNLARDHVELIHAGALTFVTDDRRDVTAHALRLAQLHPRPAPDGFLVALPNPTVLLFTPLVGLDWVLVMRELPALIAKMPGDELGTVSPHIHWVHEGRFERVGIEDTGDNITIVADERFRAVADRLMQEAASG